MYFLLADDHGLFRDSMSVWLKQLDLDTEINIDFASDYNSVIEKISGERVYDLVLLDLGMPEMQGAFSVKVLHEKLPNTPLLIVSADENPLVIQSCIEEGAAGYVTKSSDGETILQAVQQVLSGVEYIPLLARQHNNEQCKFNKKQLQLLALLAEGLGNKEIAEKMYLSEGTIKQYVSQLLRKLNVDNRMQAGLKARNILGIRGT